MNFLEGLTCRHPVDERKVNDLIVLPLILVPRAMTPHWLSEVRDEKFVGSVGTDWLIECSLSTTGSQADKFTCELVVITCNEPAPPDNRSISLRPQRKMDARKNLEM